MKYDSIKSFSNKIVYVVDVLLQVQSQLIRFYTSPMHIQCSENVI